MIELIVIAVIFSKPGEILREKGWQKTLGWEFLGIGVYLGSLFLGAMIYGALLYLVTGNVVINSYLIPYIFMYVVAYILVSLYFKMLRAFPSKVTENTRKEST